MNLKPRIEQVSGQKEFLRNTVGMQWKTGGVTLDATAFTAGQYVKAGTAVFKDTATGLFKPVVDGATPTPATMEAACLTANDVKVIAGSNPIVGALVAGHPLEGKCTGVTTNFKEAVKGRIVFDL
ncbi:hypothetical protein [Domibacillus enclensis]|uniref:Bacteriophage lambda head decoration protein D n=1 Tax=Domibacillus enclensis TaxID=1017273 RepID=A0A1N6WJ58_9BACI|nr:hypothetical protein [Domibacillus enclensis]OXS77950.1 hypothetical protein B1B05_10110 [Domibacillus enclensis]SIQ90074.1 hypothetical protein SAMN05443094_104183 [Domibacillus enclensis]